MKTISYITEKTIGSYALSRGEGRAEDGYRKPYQRNYRNKGKRSSTKTLPEKRQFGKGRAGATKPRESGQVKRRSDI